MAEAWNCLLLPKLRTCKALPLHSLICLHGLHRDKFTFTLVAETTASFLWSFWWRVLRRETVCLRNDFEWSSVKRKKEQWTTNVTQAREKFRPSCLTYKMLQKNVIVFFPWNLMFVHTWNFSYYKNLYHRTWKVSAVASLAKSERVRKPKNFRMNGNSHRIETCYGCHIKS